MKVLNKQGLMAEWDKVCLLNLSKTDFFIFTRFNLPIYSVSKFGESTKSQLWLEDRFGLFDKYCFPSVSGQTDKSFLWVVFFDVNTPPTFIKRIEKYKKVFPQLLPCFLDRVESEKLGDMMDVIVKSLKDESHLLIEGRLDNDDALNIHYVESTRFLANKKGLPTEIVSYKYGIQYYAVQNIAFRIPYVDNHFISSINRVYDSKDIIIHILQFDHSKINSYPYKFTIVNNDSCMWMETVHERNVANEVKLTLNQKMEHDYNFL